MRGMSAVVICKNAERHILEVVTALQPCDEVLVVDTGSTDKTIEILKSLHFVRIEVMEFIGFGPTKARAVSMASYDWILSIDADEIASSDLILECKQLTEKNEQTKIGRVKRINYLLGHEVKYSGWGNDRLLRFFNRNHAAFDNAPVHESIKQPKNSAVVELKGCIHHFAIDELSQFSQKTMLYSQLRAAEPNHSSSLTYACLAAAHRFLKTYVLQFGFLDGRLGFIVAVANASGVFWRHARNSVTPNYSRRSANGA